MRQVQVDQQGGVARRACGSPSPGSRRWWCCRRRPCRRRRRPSGRASPWSRPSATTRWMAASRSAVVSGSDSHSVTPRRIASSMPVGSSDLATMTTPAFGELALAAPTGRAAAPRWPRMSTTKASGPFEPDGWTAPTSATVDSWTRKPREAQRGQQVAVVRFDHRDGQRHGHLTEQRADHEGRSRDGGRRSVARHHGIGHRSRPSIIVAVASASMKKPTTRVTLTFDVLVGRARIGALVGSRRQDPPAGTAISRGLTEQSPLAMQPPTMPPRPPFATCDPTSPSGRWPLEVGESAASVGSTPVGGR